MARCALTTGPVIAGRWEIKVCRHWRSLRGVNRYLRLIFSVNRAGCPVSDPPQIEPESLVTQTVINISLCKSHAPTLLWCCGTQWEQFSGTSKLLEEEEKATFTSALKLWWTSPPLLQVTGSSLRATGIHLRHPPDSTEVMAAPSATLKAKRKPSPQKSRLCEPFCLHAADWVHLSAVGLRQSLSDLQKNRNRVTPWACGNILGIIHPTNIKRCAYFWVVFLLKKRKIVERDPCAQSVSCFKRPHTLQCLDVTVTRWSGHLQQAAWHARCSGLYLSLTSGCRCFLSLQGFHSPGRAAVTLWADRSTVFVHRPLHPWLLDVRRVNRGVLAAAVNPPLRRRTHGSDTANTSVVNHAGHSVTVFFLQGEVRGTRLLLFILKKNWDVKMMQ